MNIESIRRAAALGLASAVVTVVGLTAAAPASASTAVPGSQAVLVVANAGSQQHRSDRWYRYHERFYSWRDCDDEGSDHDNWSHYTCVKRYRHHHHGDDRYNRDHHRYYWELWYQVDDDDDDDGGGHHHGHH